MRRPGRLLPPLALLIAVAAPAAAAAPAASGTAAPAGSPAKPSAAAAALATTPATPVVAGTELLDPAPSLPHVASGHRPGPDVLYAAPPAAPQLENRDPRFHAAPLLVSGTEAYAAGEYLYSDYLYDDHGSQAKSVEPTDQTATDATNIPGPGSILSANALSYRVGSITYPTDPAYAANAADLVEFRAAVGPQDTVFRVTLDTLRRADTTIVALALDTDRNPATGTSTLPRDPGAPFPGTDAVLTTWGTGAEVSTFAADGHLLATTPVAVRADLEADQLTVTVPHAVLDPRGTVRATLATGLYDRATGGWLRPGSGATATTPGGAGPNDPNPSGIFNLGFRFDEPVLRQNTPPDEAQATALRAHAPTRFARDLDFDALAAGATRSTVPATGLQIRMFPSRQDLGGGADPASYPEFKGQLQPYAIYIPASGAASHPHPLLLSVHSNGQHYWQYDGTQILTRLGEAHDAVVLSPLGRGRDGWYVGSSEYDVFEAWADAARHVLLDPARTAVSGYSMGGYATYRLGGLYPDLFGKAFSVVGPPGKKIWVPPMPPSDGIQTLSNLWLENTRNLPFLNFAQTSDELVPVVGPVTQNVGNPALPTTSFEQLGYRYRFLLFAGGEHYTLAALGYDFPVAQDFLADTTVERDPAHVTFARVPGSDDPARGLVHDHAAWVSDVTMDDASAGPGAKGVIDARSEGFGVGDPPSAPEQTAGVMGLPYTEVGRTWGPAPRTPIANRATVTLVNLRGARLQLDRARLSAASALTLSVTSDRAAALTLAGALPADVTVTRDGAVIAATSSGDALVIPLAAGAHSYVVSPAAGASGGVGPSGARSGVTQPGKVAQPGKAARPAAHPGGARARHPAALPPTVQPSRTLAFTGAGATVPLVGLALVLLAAAAASSRRRRSPPNPRGPTLDKPGLGGQAPARAGRGA